MENHQKLLGIRRDAIANAIHHTIDTFFNSDESFRRKNSSCLYYAHLGSEVCTRIYSEINRDQSIYYSVQGGSISIRSTSDTNDTSQGVNFGGKGESDKPSFEEGRFHCWIVGLCKNGQLITPNANEFIDFTSKYYHCHALNQGHEWTRRDIDDYLWVDNQCDLRSKYGISVKADEEIRKKSQQKWEQFDSSQAMLECAVRTYLSLYSKRMG